MKLLFLANTCPFPANNGLTLRSSSVLRALVALGHEVQLISFQEGDPSPAVRHELSQLCAETHLIPAEFVNVSSRGRYWDRLAKLFSPLPYGLLRYRSKAFSAAVHGLLQRKQFDAIVCDTIDSVLHLPSRLPAPLIVNNHNVEHLILERFLRHTRNPAKRFYGWIEARKIKRWEETACNRADAVWVCSGFDCIILQRLCPEVRFRIVPNAIDLDFYTPTLDEQQEPIVLYTGGMDWYPTRDAVEFFVSPILPQLEKLEPAVKFVVAGRAPEEEFRRRWQRRNVVFTGTVPDMRAQIARAAVGVVPLRIGSGTRLKILEAAALAKPVVSTTLGAEGLEFSPDQEIFLADEPAAFARSVAELLHDLKKRTHTGQAARKRLQENYGFDSLRRAIKSSLQEILGATATAGSPKSAEWAVAQ